MFRSIKFVLCLSIFVALPSAFALEVTKIATLQDATQRAFGVGGPFVGILHDKLVIAGGTNFPDAPPWRGGQRQYHDAIHILEHESEGGYRWRPTSIRLPSPLANGACVSTASGVYLFGGRDANGPTDECWKLVWRKGELALIPLPKLPMPLSFPSVAVYGNTAYLAGGFTDEDAGKTSNAFLSLDLERAEHVAWETLPGWDGPSRALSVCAVQNIGNEKAFFLFGGRRYEEGKMIELGDAWCYGFNSQRWQPVENVDKVPFTFSAATAAASGTTHILFFGSANVEAMRERERLSTMVAEARQTDAVNVEDLQRQLNDFLDQFPGFSNDIHAYNTITKKFFLLAKAPQPLPLVTPVVAWRDGFVLACGEDAPGRRSPDVLHLKIAKANNNLGILNITVMAIYFVLMLAMGVFFSKRQKETDDYFRGGRRVSWLILGISLFGTTLSSISYMAVPAKTFMTNWNYIFLAIAPLWVSPLIVYFLIPNLRKYDLISAYEYLERRFSLTVRLFGSFVFMLFQVARIAVVLFLPAIALSVVTNIDIYACILVVGIVSLVYTLHGGIEAVIWTDVVQAIILIGGLIVALYIAVAHLDANLMEAARLAASEHKLSLGSSAVNFKEPTILTIIVASIFLYLIPFSCDQSLVQRYFVSKTDSEASKGLWVNAWLTFPCSLLLFALGTAFYLFYQENPAELSVTMSNNDSLFPWFIITQIPPGLSGLVIVAIFAAAMSTVSASVNAIAAAYTVDFHQRLFARTETPSLFCAKAATLVSGVLGIGLALHMVTWDISSFWDEYNRLAGLITSVLAGLFFLGVLSKRANAPGALIGFSAGIAVQLLVSQYKMVHILLYAGTGFVSCLVIGYFASLFFSPPVISIPVKKQVIAGPPAVS